MVSGLGDMQEEGCCMSMNVTGCFDERIDDLGELVLDRGETGCDKLLRVKLKTYPCQRPQVSFT
jgi:hypothetical protein